MLRIVVVCTGNRARSPLAEVHLRQLARGLPVEVSSVGLLDLGPVPALPEMVEVARAAGLDLSHPRARVLSGVDLSQTDLVIGLERNHVAAAVVEGNVPFERTFTLRELVRLLAEIEPPDEADTVARARTAIARAHELRQAHPSFVPGEDIEDPFGGPRQGYYDMARAVGDLCRGLMEGLVGPRALAARQPSSR
jgi:protein-tyrosine phosphatase